MQPRSNLPIRPAFLVRFEGQHPLLTRRTVQVVYAGLLLGFGLLLFLWYLTFNLPDLTHLEKPQYDLPTRVYDLNGELVTEFYVKRRVLIPFEEVPPVVVQALLAIEDSRFYYHYGIDFIRVGQAFLVDLIKMDFAQGASTLTQQTAKMFLLSSEKKIIRKIKELLLAVQIESRFTKNEILELYLNKTYFGHGAYGIEAAAQVYFSKSARQLDLKEAALLAGLPQAPSRWAPTASMENATKRRNLVLLMMENEGYITEDQMKEAIAQPIELKLSSAEDSNEASYYMEYVRRMVLDLYGMDQLYKGGLKVYTHMDLKMQIAAQQSLKHGLLALDQRQGYRRSTQNLWQTVGEKTKLDLYQWDKTNKRGHLLKAPKEDKEKLEQTFNSTVEKTTSSNQFVLGGKLKGVVRSVSNSKALVELGAGKKGWVHLEGHRWARPVDFEHAYAWGSQLKDLRDILLQGDVIEVVLEDYIINEDGFALSLYQRPEANGGLFVTDPRNGEVRAMSGGFDFADSEYNRAIQAKRQPGSAFKPIVYSLALDNSFTRASILDDTPLVFKDTQWRPGNYSKSYKGKISFKNALAQSKNIPTIRLVMALGIDKVIEQANKLGLTGELPNDLTIGLGTASVTLKDLSSAYGIFANGGYLIEPGFVSRIEDQDGKVIYQEPKPKANPVMSPETAFLMTATLQDVVNFGSGIRARAIGRPAAGKTGTTNNYTDAWFMGYIPQLLAGVYVGFDDNQKTLGAQETGSQAATPIWVEFMKQATESLPVLPFEQPKGIEMVRIVPESGLKDCDDSQRARFEYFKAGTEPTECHQDTGDYSDYASPDPDGGDPEAPQGDPEANDQVPSGEAPSAGTGEPVSPQGSGGSAGDNYEEL